ncbi:MAG: hypothetical protein H6R13_2727 [Proteobacteria bacterium]|nr:hypothetical protein [Pseudomonadota bacterium]
MIQALINRRIEIAIQSTPAILRWIEQCDPKVMAAYRAVRRGLFIWQLPALTVVAAVALPIKAFHWLPVGHPFLIALFLVALSIFAWPPLLTRFAAVAWRMAPVEPKFSVRLRFLAGLIYACVAVYAVGLVGLSTFFAFAFFK